MNILMPCRGTLLLFSCQGLDGLLIFFSVLFCNSRDDMIHRVRVLHTQCIDDDFLGDGYTYHPLVSRREGFGLTRG